MSKNIYLSDNGDHMEDDEGMVIFDNRKKRCASEMEIAKADYLFHDVMHSNITAEQALAKCPAKDKSKLKALLREAGEI